eukprot:GFUD01043217.1.p1 GENE.GFUD01043217.1~~GFUD01043217.1.p1  ORF type:complete len:330 (+),score=114.01 GFUD01043217.1:65-1054(+)
MWEKVTTTSPTTMHYDQYKKEQTKLVDPSTCFCLPLRSGVLAIGLIGSTLAISGLVAYAIVQVPTLRVHVGQYFTNTMTHTKPKEQDLVVDENNSLRQIAYTAEIVGAALGASIGLLVNILLVFGVLWRRRWFLMHWLVIHLLALILLFLTSILLFVVQVNLWKLIGIVPVGVAIFTMYCWTKVYSLFCSLHHLPDHDHYDHHPPPCKLHPHDNSLAPPFMLTHHNPGWMEEVGREGREISTDQVEELGPGVEFYPLDSLSRGMVDRMRVFNRSLPNMVYLPYEQNEQVDEFPSTRRSWDRERYQPTDQYLHKEEEEGDTDSNMSAVEI